MQNLTKQVNFKTNPEILAEAQAVLRKQNLSLSSVLNNVLESLATKKVLPKEFVNSDEDERIFEELRSEIQQGYDSYRAGKKMSSQEMRSHFGL